MVMIVAMVMQPQSVKSFLSLKAAKYLRALALVRRLRSTASNGLSGRASALVDDPSDREPARWLRANGETRLKHDALLQFIYKLVSAAALMWAWRTVTVRVIRANARHHLAL